MPDFRGVRIPDSVSISHNSQLATRPQFFPDFHQILQAAQECGLIDAYLWDKPEAVCWF